MPLRDSAAIDAALRAGLDGGRIGCVVAAAADRRHEIYAGAFGHRDSDGDTAVDIDSVFRILSMTKAVTSVAAMQLIERGELALDQPAVTALPELAELQILEGFGTDGAPRLRRLKNSPTVHQLLTHTSGFAYEMWSEPIAQYLAWRSDHPDAGRPLTSALAGGDSFLNAPVTFEPGTRWMYGIGTDWLGRIVERVSGCDLEAYFREHITGPLGMADTSFEPTEEQLARLVTAHRAKSDGTLVSFPASLGASQGFYSGGGGLFSTARDYLAFLRALLGGGEVDGTRILSERSVDAMTKNQIGKLEVETLMTTDPATSVDVDFFPGHAKSWGLGFLICEQAVPSGRAAGSYGWAGLFNSYYWVDPGSGLCAVLLTQQLPFFAAGPVALLDRFERSLYAAVN